VCSLISCNLTMNSFLDNNTFGLLFVWSLLMQINIARISKGYTLALAVVWRPPIGSLAGQVVCSYDEQRCAGPASLRASFSPVSDIPSWLYTHFCIYYLPTESDIKHCTDELRGAGSVWEADSHWAVFCGTGRFTTEFKSFCLWNLFWASLNQSHHRLGKLFELNK
jgi:hypothetical protein